MLSRPQGKLRMEPQAFCGLKEIELKTMKIQQKNPTLYNNYAIENY